MHLKALTLRGFKSFASATTLRFEPGITCVVGPNGSGKSNVVDALSWVMGEQGAKSLRGGKMEDVIFAGTTGRPPLGRAEVSLTIDNSDGALPIEYAEVTITRIMFRNGGSEYQINGDTCRLLDIQELLSDSGIGREMHVIVGQGQLDSVLHADPMGRRAFIEEAAGVLKHRKRKEKALRKLDAMQANLARVQDLTDELRRQLKPLGRQAAVARRAAVIQADLRDARLRLLADDLVRLREALKSEIADEAALKERKESAEQELKKALQREALLEDEVRQLTPRLQLAQQTWYELSQLAERVRGTISLADARVKSATSVPPRSGAAGTPRTWSARPPASVSRRPSWRPLWKRPNAPSTTPSPTAQSWSGSWRSRNAASRTSPAPSPTAAKGWPGSPARSTRPARAPRPRRPRSTGWPPPATRPRSARPRPRRSTRP
ncbi:AAA family ATPase [Streptomyces griseochromogenes]|uniref:AAA family ATPase n=1 Tax=Streptomyces griseochromogenes TaxID=68214 RepID=UPI00269028C5